jgi:predicted transglutaminase-like cysteine proteinase
VLRCAIVAGLLFLCSPAAADSIDTIATGAAASPRPLGWEMFCREHRNWCAGLPATKPLPATTDLMVLLARVNVAVNRAITYRPDRGVIMAVKDRAASSIRVEEWTIGPNYGDCDDYSVTKLARLIDAGLPRSALRLAVYRLPNGVHHAVLTVETGAGTLVLSNLSDAVMPWRAVPSAEWRMVERVSEYGFMGLWELR